MKWMTLTAALIVCSSFSSAQAGLFGCCHKNNCCESSCQTSCCEAAPTCCAAPAPTCCAAPAPTCCEAAPSCGCGYDSCDNGCGCKKPCFLSRLFKGCHKNNCCQSSCCEQAPVCCEQAPVCNTCDTGCGCGNSCGGCKKPCFLSKLFSGCHKNRCCEKSYDCGCNTCGAAPTCSTCGH